VVTLEAGVPLFVGGYDESDLASTRRVRVFLWAEPSDEAPRITASGARVDSDAVLAEWLERARATGATDVLAELGGSR
jgi:hypothetical protein